MNPLLVGCVCAECKRWHDIVKKRKDGKYVCINCYYDLKGGKKRKER
ncbi:MAG: hypothetical protein ACTSVB_04490 [Candidatus Heimdallarchaeaceae archaeon]